MFEDLLDVDIHLPEEGGGDGVAVAFAGQDGGAALEAKGWTTETLKLRKLKAEMGSRGGAED